MTTQIKNTNLIYKKIPLIMADIGSIGKDRKNTQQHYDPALGGTIIIIMALICNSYLTNPIPQPNKKVCADVI